MNKKNIFIVGYYGYQNTGDDAMLEGLKHELKDHNLMIYKEGFNSSKIIECTNWADIVILGNVAT